MQMSKAPRATILGIDPGYADTGYGIITKSGRSLTYVACDTISTSARLPFSERLLRLADALDALVQEFHPALIAIEKIYFAKNLKTAVNVAQARGVALVTAARHRVALAEYTPLEVKQSLTSYGHATKEQVAQMVRTILRLASLKKKDDAVDALAIAICAAFRYKAAL